MNVWYLSKVKFTAQDDDGSLKRVTAPILVSATNFTDVEAKIVEEMSQTVKGEFKILGINPTKYSDIFDYSESDVEENYFFDCKISYMSVTEEKSKKCTIPVLISAKDLKEAESRLKESMKPLISHFDIVSIKKTNIMTLIM